MTTDIDVFISYSRKDADFAKKLYSVLHDQGLNPWLDSERILNGFLWREEIDQNLDRASLVVIIVSPDSMRSAYVTYEWCRAWLKSSTELYWIYFKRCNNKSGVFTRLGEFQFPYDKCLNGSLLDSDLETITGEIQKRLQYKSELAKARDDLLRRASTEEKRIAAEILGNAETHAAIACGYLLEGLKRQLISDEANGEAQRAIASALQRVGDFRAIPYLLKLREFTTDPNVQIQIESTLNHLIAQYTS